MSLMVAISRRNSMVRSHGLPSGWRCGVPSASKQGQCAPSQLAWRLPLANAQLPLMRQPPSTRIAFAHAPRQNIALAAEHFARDTWFQVACRHRTAGALVHAPGDRRIAAGDRFHALDVGRRIELSATHGARHQQAEHAVGMHCVEHVGRQFVRRIDARRGCGKQRRKLAGPRDMIGRNAGLVHVHRVASSDGV
jgi:hypothetical protein